MKYFLHGGLTTHSLVTFKWVSQHEKNVVTGTKTFFKQRTNTASHKVQHRPEPCLNRRFSLWSGRESGCMHKCFWVYLRQKWQISQLNFYLLLVYIPHGQNSRNMANCSFVLNFDFIGKFSLVLYLQSNRKRKFILWPWAVCLNVYLTLHFLFIDLVSSRWFWYHSSCDDSGNGTMLMFIGNSSVGYNGGFIILSFLRTLFIVTWSQLLPSNWSSIDWGILTLSQSLRQITVSTYTSPRPKRFVSSKDLK